MRSIINYLKRLNDILPSLVATILVYGLLVLAVGIWFFDDKSKYIIGLLFGIAQAIFMSIHMAGTILDSLGVSDKKGQVLIGAKSMSRYAVVAVTTAIMCYFQWGYVGTWIVGIMGLKVAAYMQPLIHRFKEKRI